MSRFYYLQVHVERSSFEVKPLLRDYVQKISRVVTILHHQF